MKKIYKFILLSSLILITFIFIGSNWNLASLIKLSYIKSTEFGLSDSDTVNIPEKYWGFMWFDKNSGRFAYIDTTGKKKYIADTIYGTYSPVDTFLNYTNDTFGILTGNKFYLNNFYTKQDSFNINFKKGDTISSPLKITVYNNGELFLKSTVEDSLYGNEGNILSFYNVSGRTNNYNQIISYLSTNDSLSFYKDTLAVSYFPVQTNVFSQLFYLTIKDNSSDSLFSSQLGGKLSFPYLGYKNILNKYIPIIGIKYEQRQDTTNNNRTIFYSGEDGFFHIPCVTLDTIVKENYIDYIYDVCPFTESQMSFIKENDEKNNDIIEQTIEDINLTDKGLIKVYFGADSSGTQDTVQLFFKVKLNRDFINTINYYRKIFGGYVRLRTQGIFRQIYLRTKIGKNTISGSNGNLNIKCKLLLNKAPISSDISSIIEAGDIDITDSISIDTNNVLQNTDIIDFTINGLFNISKQYEYGILSLIIIQLNDSFPSDTFKLSSWNIQIENPDSSSYWYNPAP